MEDETSYADILLFVVMLPNLWPTKHMLWNVPENLTISMGHSYPKYVDQRHFHFYYALIKLNLPWTILHIIPNNF